MHTAVGDVNKRLGLVQTYQSTVHVLHTHMKESLRDSILGRHTEIKLWSHQNQGRAFQKRQKQKGCDRGALPPMKNSRTKVVFFND